MSSGSRDSSAEAAQAASGGGMVIAVPGAARSRSWITNVPANRSPSRLPLADSSEAIRAGAPARPQAQALAKPFRAAVVTDHPQPQGQLAQRLAPAERLEQGRVADDDPDG